MGKNDSRGYFLKLMLWQIYGAPELGESESDNFEHHPVFGFQLLQPLSGAVLEDRGATVSDVSRRV